MIIKRKRRYKKWNRGKDYKKSNYIIMIIVIILMFTGYIFIKIGITYKKNIMPVYNYKIQKNTNYEVALKPNIFYETETLKSGGYYASRSINAYKINFEYIFQGDKEANFECTYNVIANLVGTVNENDNQEKEVWNRNFILNENTSNKYSNVNKFSISTDTNIDYEYYNNFARSYEKTYGIIIDSVLKVHLNISYSFKSSELETETQKLEDSIDLEIPITNTLSEVNEDYEKTVENSINPEIENITTIQIICYVIGGIFVLGAMSLIIIEIIRKNKKEREQMYEYNINRILKYYRDLIVTIKNEPDLTNLKIMKLFLLEDLILSII